MAWRQRQLNMIQRRQDHIVAVAVRKMDKAMKKIVEEVWESYERGGTFTMPNTNHLYDVSEEFYRAVVKTAYISAKQTKAMQMGDRKRMAKNKYGNEFGKLDLKDTVLDKETIGDKDYWQKIFRRSKKLTDRMRKSYLEKLRKTFDKIIPMVVDNRVTPAEAKQGLLYVFKASKSRVETIFRTETTNYFGKTQVDFFSDDEDIIGFLFDSVKDSSATDICRARHGLVYRPGSKELKANTPALHYNCRSHLIPLANTPENIRLVSDPSRNPKNRSVPRVPPGWGKG